MKNNLKLFYLGLYLCSGIATAGTRINYDLDLSFSSDDNINNSLISGEERDDSTYLTSFAVAYQKRLSKHDSASANGFINYSGFSEYDGLSHSEIGAEINYNLKPVSGFSQPTYIFSGKISTLDFETDLRDSTQFNIKGMLAKSITDKLSMRTGLAYKLNDSESRVYDTSDIRLFINADLLLGKRATLYSTLDYISGDIVSIISEDNLSSNVLDILDSADEIQSDPSFANNEIAYRVDADTITLSLGLNVKLAKKQSVDLFARTISSEVSSNISYNRLIVSLSYLARF